jgi:hypothetical protein
MSPPAGLLCTVNTGLELRHEWVSPGDVYEMDHRQIASSLLSLNPDLNVAGFFAGLDVDDARATTDRAIFGVSLALATAKVDAELVALTAERTLDPGGPASRRTLRHEPKPSPKK